MDIYRKILSYLSANDKGEFIDITHLDSDYKFLSSKARELSTSGYIKIESAGLYIVGNGNGTSKTYGSKENLKILKAKILLAGQEYLSKQSSKNTSKREISKEKKLAAIKELIFEARTWKGYDGGKVKNFIVKAKETIGYIDGSDSQFALEIDIFNFKKPEDQGVIGDWDERIISTLERLKTKIDFEESDLDLTIQNSLVYVSQTRIEELKNIRNSNFDLIKLIQLCKELNDAYKLENYYTVGIIVRTIINHVPPVFGKENFASVVSQYKSDGNSGSFKGSMEYFENTSRKIADSFAHSITRKKENLPTETQVDFRHGLDVLLGEIVRVLK